MPNYEMRGQMTNTCSVQKIESGHHFSHRGRFEISRARVAVPPLSNPNCDPEQSNFCESISAEILIYLARTRGIKVIVRSSLFRQRYVRTDCCTADRRGHGGSAGRQDVAHDPEVVSVVNLQESKDPGLAKNAKDMMDEVPCLDVRIQLLNRRARLLNRLDQLLFRGRLIHDH